MWHKISSGLSAALIGSSAIVLIQPQVAVSQTLDEQVIAAIAKESTVVINGQNPGSGVIVSRDGNTYYVLTAKHVVPTQDEYEIVTSDGTKYPLNYSSVKKLTGVDLALVEFTSDKNYPMALLGDSAAITEGATVYISGWPHPGRAITQRIYQITKGSISGRPLESLENGYDLVYTNITRSGMSGGPVWDAQGRVIGIHGEAEGEQIINPDGNTIAIKSGFNLGIPINSFLKVASQQGITLSYLRDKFSLTTTILSDKRCLEKADKVFRLSPISQIMAIALKNGGIRLCQRNTGKELQIFSGNYSRIRSLLFSPDGETLASIGSDERDIYIIKIWNVNTGQLQHSFTTDYVIFPYLFNFSPDGNIFASGHDKTIKIWNLRTGKLLHEHEFDRNADYWELAISPDSQILASGHFDGRIEILNLRTGKLLRTLAGHSTPVNKLMFSPFGQILVSGGSSSKDIHINGSPQGNVDDASLKMWNWQTGELLGTLIENSGTIASLAIEPYGQILASSSRDEIKIWSLHTRQLLRTLDTDKSIESLIFSADSQTLFSNHRNGETQVWQSATP